MKVVMIVLGFLLFLIAIWSSPVLAYIDPGSGSSIMSALIGLVLAVSIAVKTYWYKFRSLLGLDKASKDDSSLKTQKDEVLSEPSKSEDL